MDEETLQAKSEVVLVTPDLAKAWLERNVENRALRRKTVNQYATDMINGKWGLLGDSICFDAENKLTNGQHRLTAVVASNTSQYFNVMTGISHNVNMDRGIQRSTADNVKMFTDLPGICANHTVVSTVNYILKLLHYNVKSANVTYDFMHEHKGEILGFWKDVGFGRYIKYGQYKRSSILAAFFLAYINDVDVDILKNMKTTLETGEYIFQGFETNRFLPAFRLERVLRELRYNRDEDRYLSFMCVQNAIHSIASNKYLKSRPKEADQIFFDIEYQGKKLSDIHTCKVANSCVPDTTAER